MSLLKKIELFERLALYGNRSDFINKIAQFRVKDDITNTMLNNSAGALRDAVGDWQNANQAEIPSRLQNALSAVSNASTASKFDSGALNALYSGASELAAVQTFKDMDEKLKDSWLKIVFPKASNTMNLVSEKRNILKRMDDEIPPPEPIPEKTVPQGQKLNGAELSRFFYKVYGQLQSGQTVNENDLATWKLNADALKGRLSRLPALIDDVTKKMMIEEPGATPQKAESLKKEKEALEFVISKLG